MNAKVVDVIKETSDVITLRLGLESPIKYEPGQFITIILSVGDEGKKVVARRAYSISSWPESQPTNEITITLNKMPDGKGHVSDYLFGLKKGDSLEMDGPYGLFKLNYSDKPVIFIAAGTGITPIMTMIESLKDSAREMTLIYSIKSRENIVFREKLKAIADSGRLKFVPTLTQETAEGWKTGRVSMELLQENLSHETDSYICGKPDFVKSVTEHLKELGLDEKCIHTERW